MGKVYTTSEDLTSVANAIRAKSGSNSSLVYPSGFVSAIGNILGDIWDGFGANPEFVLTLYTESLTLADTNLEGMASSTFQTIRNSTEIINTSNNNTISLNWNYDYRIEGNGKIVYAYLSEITPRILTLYYTVNFLYSTILGNIDDITNNTRLTLTNENLDYFSKTIYKNYGNDTQILVGQSGITYGITLGPNCNYNLGLISLSTPTIYASINYSFMPRETFDAIDINNTTLDFNWKLYRYTTGSTCRAIANNKLNDLLLTDYPQYAPQQS